MKATCDFGEKLDYPKQCAERAATHSEWEI